MAHAGFAAYEEDGFLDLSVGFQLPSLIDEIDTDAGAVAWPVREAYGENDQPDGGRGENGGDGDDARADL